MPFLIRYPRKIQSGSTSSDMVLNVDFASTLLDFAGLPIPASFQGRSFRSLLQGRTPGDWRQSMYYRYWMQREIWHSTVAHYGVRTHRHKLIYYYGQGCGQPGSLDLPSPPEWELFDLEKDPRELHNVAEDPAYAGIRAELTKELDRLQMQVGDTPMPGDQALITRPPNLLLMTADDMNWDAVGAFGCPVAGTTPNLDRLAAGGLRFEHAHVNIAVCQPSRSVLMTGRYPHRCGGEGFHTLRVPGVPILPELLRAAGYRVGILGKVPHSTPYADFRWDMAYDMDELGHGRNPALYRQHAEAFVREAREAGRPFFLMVNSHDPHRPFHGNDPAEWYQDGDLPRAAVPSRVFTPGEIQVPGFLPDLPEVRREIAEYYSSARRCDDTLGAVLDGLAAQGAQDNTLTTFLSDNGMAVPFAKTNCYLNSTRTPWIMYWPGRILPGTADCDHFVSGIDLLPTFLEAAGAPIPAGVDGCSMLPLLRGERQANRERVFTQFHQSAGKGNYPMRCVQTATFGYIFNPWCDGTRTFRNESQIGRTFSAMQAAAASSPEIAARVDLFLHRVPEELYDFAADPDALHNRIDDPDCAATLEDLRRHLERWMVETGDPALEAFRARGSRAALDAFLETMNTRLGGHT